MPLDGAVLERCAAQPEPARRRAEEARFDCRWAETLVEHALDRLADECARQHGADYFTRLLPFLQIGVAEGTGVTRVQQQAAAAGLGLSPPAFKSALHRLRDRYRTLLREAVTQTVGSTTAVEPELRHLCAALAANDAAAPG